MLAKNTLYEAVDGFSIAMLTTLTPEGALRSRPMTVARREGSTFWFATSLESGVADDIRSVAQADITFQSNFVYASIFGEAEVVDDPELVRSLWNDSWAAWFPHGPTDPDLVLVKVVGRSGDLWDLRGSRGLKAALQMVSAAVNRRLAHQGQGHIAL